MPGGTRSFNMTKPVDGSEVDEGSYVPVDENKLKKISKRTSMML